MAGLQAGDRSVDAACSGDEDGSGRGSECTPLLVPLLLLLPPSSRLVLVPTLLALLLLLALRPWLLLLLLLLLLLSPSSHPWFRSSEKYMTPDATARSRYRQALLPSDKGRPEGEGEGEEG